MTNNKTIYYILIIAFAIRLTLITAPVSGFHSWRQADTASIAKNFYETGNSIIYPQINWGGTTEGYVESEFHIYPYLVSWLYKIFSPNDLWGRLLSVIFSLFTIFYLYLLTRKLLNERIALWAAFVYSIMPLNIFFSRAFMPESLMLMSSVIGIYYFLLWSDEQKTKYYLLSLLFITVAVLVKLPTLYIGILLIFILYSKNKFKFLLNIKVWIFVLAVLGAAFAWYYHAHELYKQTGLTFNIWGYGKDKWGTYGLLINPEFYNSIFLKSIAERHITYAGFILFIWGLFIKRKSKQEYFFDWWLISILFFILFVSQGNLAQEYYQLPISLPASVFIAKVLDKYLNFQTIKTLGFKKSLVNYTVVLLFIFLLVLSSFRYINLLNKESDSQSLFQLSNEIKNISGKNDLIITIADGNPTYLYSADRKGWILNPAEISQQRIDSLKNSGAKFLIAETYWLDKSDNKSILLESNSIFMKNDKFLILKF